MFEHYLPNKNERATVAPKSKFTQLNKGLRWKRGLNQMISISLLVAARFGLFLLCLVSNILSSLWRAFMAVEGCRMIWFYLVVETVI